MMANSQLILGTLVVMVTVWLDKEVTCQTWVTFNPPVLFHNTIDRVNHMEMDLSSDDSSILYSSGNSLRTSANSIIVTTNGTIHGFKQLDATQIVLVVGNQHCVQTFDRVSQQLLTIAGSCGISGYDDGEIGSGTLNYPHSIEVYDGNSSMLLVTDEYNDALRSVDMQTGELATVVDGLSHPRGMAWVNSTLLLVANNHYISEIRWLENETVTSNVLAGSAILGDGFGKYIWGQPIFNFPHGLEKIKEDLYLVADTMNLRLKLLNRNSSRIESVYTGERDSLELFPVSIIYDGDDVYFSSSNHSIYKLGEMHIL